ncbi:hypothetical protein L1987_45440 [Smallanthus sonchifolius]|uniref:Uncharacterized protein n=1 Tax=Smallanthus sonchifolius TaxID=185202 RepID=A0ACB9FY13_9ASTR|nr:hypothetical protein L1987_45440 [Smallanthus sonchifolius]
MQPSQASRTRQIVKAATLSTTGGSFLVLSGLKLTGTVIALTMVTPLLLIFSPVLIPAGITIFLLAIGFLASGGFGLAAFAVLSLMYKCVKSRHPNDTDSSDQTRQTMGHKA